MLQIRHITQQLVQPRIFLPGKGARSPKETNVSPYNSVQVYKQISRVQGRSVGLPTLSVDTLSQ